MLYVNYSMTMRRSQDDRLTKKDAVIGVFFSVAKTEQIGLLVWRKQNTEKVAPALERQRTQPFLAVVGVFFLSSNTSGNYVSLRPAETQSGTYILYRDKVLNNIRGHGGA